MYPLLSRCFDIEKNKFWGFMRKRERGGGGAWRQKKRFPWVKTIEDKCSLGKEDIEEKENEDWKMRRASIHI